MMALLVAGAFSACKKTQGCTDPNSLTFNPDAKKDDGSCVVAEDYQGVLLIDFTQTWCPPCGSWGIPMVESVIESHKPRIRPIASHGSVSQPDAYLCNVAAKLNQAYKINAFPTILVGNKKVGGNKPAADKEVNDIISAGVTASTAGVATVSGDNVTVDLQVKFFKEATGNYYVNVFILENDIYDVQQGYPGGMYNHMHVLRGAIAENGAEFMEPFGKQVASGTTAKGKIVNEKLSGSLAGNWKKDKLEYLVIVWKVNSASDFEFVNASYAQIAD